MAQKLQKVRLKMYAKIHWCSKPTWEVKLMLLQIENVVAGYGGSDILKGVNLTVEKGSITCIVGPNGAGKSTVMRTISGLLKPRLGEITFDGHPIAGLRPYKVLALGIVQLTS